MDCGIVWFFNFLYVNFRDEKSERFGFALRASYSRSVGRMLVLSLLATLSTIVLWLIGYHAEKKGLHLRYQANSIKTQRVISYLTLAENVLRHSPLILRRTVLSTVLNHLAKTYQNMVSSAQRLVYMVSAAYRDKQASAVPSALRQRWP